MEEKSTIGEKVSRKGHAEGIPRQAFPFPDGGRGEEGKGKVFFGLAFSSFPRVQEGKEKEKSREKKSPPEGSC